MEERVGETEQPVAEPDVALQEHAIPRHHDLVEHRDRVHLVEARRQRIVTELAARIEALTADESEAGGRHRNREGKGVPARVRRVRARGRGKHHQLVRVGRERGQHPRAAHHEAIASLADDVQRHVRVRLLGLRARAVDLWIHEGMRGAEVSLPAKLVVCDDPLAILGAVLLEVRPGGGEASHDGVQVVRRATEQAAMVVRPGLEHDAAADEIVDRSRLDEGEAHGLARARRRIGQTITILRHGLQVVQLGKRAGRSAEDRVLGHVADALSVEPHLARPAKSFQVFGSGPSRHTTSSFQSGEKSPSASSAPRCGRTLLAALASRGQAKPQQAARVALVDLRLVLVAGSHAIHGGDGVANESRALSRGRTGNRCRTARGRRRRRRGRDSIACQAPKSAVSP